MVNKITETVQAKLKQLAARCSDLTTEADWSEIYQLIAQLQRQAQARQAEANALYHGTQAITSALSERQIYETLFEQIKFEDPCQIAVYRFHMVAGEPAWAELKTNWLKQNNQTTTPGTRLYLPETAHARLLTLADPLFVEDVATDPHLSVEERDSFQPAGAASVAILPLSSVGQELGTLIIYFTQPRTFSKATRRFWLAIASQARLALSNRQLTQESVYRVVQMETAAEVSRAASSLLDLTELLNSSVALIRDRFDLYYVGAFLIDGNREWAVLRAGTGEAGRIQIKNKHRLKIGSESMIGWCIQNRQPRIALDVGKEAVHFQNPHLPDTRSEMALPLIHRNRAIGALTVQSTEQAAFSREDIIFLQTMADQMANAIENARLYEQAQQELEERKRIDKELRTSEKKYRELVQSANSIIFRMDTQGRVTFFNEFAQSFFGYPEDEILGRHVVGTIVPQTDTAGKDLAEMIDGILENPEKYASNENENCKRDGERVWISWANQAIFDDAGHFTEVLCVGNDSTQRKQSEQEILRRNQELAALNRVAATITATPDPRDRFREIAHEMVEIFKARRSGIALLTPDRQNLTVVADYTTGTEPSAEGYQIPLQDNPSSVQVIETKQSVVVSDVQTNPLTEPIHDIMRNMGIECIMIVPLITRGQVIGTLGVDLDTPNRQFTPEEVRLAETIAGQISGAIENAQLLEQTQTALTEREQAQKTLATRERYLATQLEIQNTLLASKGDVPYPTILQMLGDVSGASRVYIFENHQDEPGNLLTSQKAEWCAEGITPQIDNPELQNLPFNEVIPRWATELGQGNIIEGIVANFPKEERLILEPQHIKAILVLPLMVSNSFFGFIGFDNCQQARPWDNSEVGLLSSAAAAVSLWHERRQAEESLLKALERTETLYRIGDAVAAITEEQTLYKTILGEYLRLLNLPGGALALLHKTKAYHTVHLMYVEGEAVPTNITIPAEDTLLQHLVNNPQSLIIEDIQTHPLTKNNETMPEKLPLKSALYSPVVLRGAVIGFIVAGSPQKGYRFSQTEVELGQAVTDQLALWLENRRLLTEARYRSDRLQTAAEISGAASSILDPDELITSSVNLIRDQFGFYYVGLFLVDEEGEWAVLKAGTGQAGRLQLERKHRLKIGGESMIGWSVANKQARIALDVGSEAVHFKNPILPDTHSEMALPLISRGEVIGALTVQSTERGAFSDEDITLLQTMADQLANAIVNARLYENAAQTRKQAEARLQETLALQQLSRNLAGTLEIDEILDEFFRACTNQIGFEYVQFSLVDPYQKRVRAIAGIGLPDSQIQRSNHRLDSNDIMVDIVKTGKTEVITGWDERFDKETFEAEGHADWIRIFTPITLRQENIGLVEAGFNKNNLASITDSQVRLLRAFINQTALAMDNANRYQASQKAARREALIKEITTKVRASTDLETILQTTVTELGKAITSKRAYIHLASRSDTNGQATLETNIQTEAGDESSPARNGGQQ